MELDANSWYRLTTTAALQHQQSLAGSYPYIDGKEGLVTFGSSDDSVSTQQWQLFPVDASRYMLRTKASGPHGYLATMGRPGAASSSKPLIYNHSTTDNSMLWTMQQWVNGTFRLSNDADGDTSYLDFQGIDGIAMSTNTTQPQLGQAFSLLKLSPIDDTAFSTVDTPPPSPRTTTFASRTIPFTSGTSTPAVTRNVTSAATSFQTDPSPTTAPSLPATPAPQKTRGGLSFSAILGIGVTIGVVGVIAILAIGLYAYKRWKRNKQLRSQHYRQAKLWKGFSPVNSPPIRSTTVAEKRMGGVYIAELPVPASPPTILSPPLSGGGHLSWNSRFSWHSISGEPLSTASPSTPRTPRTPPVELPV